MKKSFKILIIAFLFILYIYICKINSIPNDLYIYKGQELKFNNFLGITLNVSNTDIYASSSLSKYNNEMVEVDVKVFDLLKVKKINVNILDELEIVPVGQISGLKLYSSQIMVVGMGEIKGEDNKKYKPYDNLGIKEGARISKINEKQITDIAELVKSVNEAQGEEIELEYIQDEKVQKCKITPKKAYDGTYKLGLWVRDSSAGLGTLSFIEPKTRKFCSTSGMV